MKNFENLRQAFLKGQLTQDSNVVAADRLLPFPEDKIVALDDLKESTKGLQYLKEGKWARLILNGGMATRFGGRVKGICEVYEGKTFLELKIENIKKIEDALNIPEIPVALMNSPATAKLTTKFLEDNNYFGRQKLTCFIQEDYPRLTLEGEIFEDEGSRSRAPRGHGDFMWALKSSGTFASWKEAGVSHFDFSNIDNLGSSVEPSLLGDFIDSKKYMGIELVRKDPGDAGGAACLRDGVMGVLEGIYFDPIFDQDILPFFSSNNLLFEIAALESLLSDEEFTLPWNVVIKKVKEQEVIQFERIAVDTVYAFNQVKEDDNVRFYDVPREGAKGRFYPVKSPDDLENLREKLKERMQQIPQ